MKLRAPSYLVLGMLRLGMRSGYAIKKAADASTHFFWPTSLAQVYPELAKLERAGFVARREDPQGARARSAYELTAEGQAALLAWLRSYRPPEAPPQFRDEGVLRLFFADALAAADRRLLVRLLRRRAAAAESYTREQIIPLAEAQAQETGTRFPGIVARLGADTYAFVAEWLERLEGELAADASDPA